jgi:hypothetical protein
MITAVIERYANRTLSYTCSQTLTFAYKKLI